MKLPFNQASYLAQVRRLRALATVALKKYPIKVDSVHFIHHGENATFRIEASGGRKFLLRIHRGGYHSEKGIQEELSWLAYLSKSKELSVPCPVKSKTGNLVEFVTSVDIPDGRNCCLFKWIDGTFIYKSLSASHMFSLGQLIASLQSVAPKQGVRHRKYWTANGLVGKTPKFGSIEMLSGVSSANQKIISEARSIVFRKLLAFEKKFPQRQGMIHADLHFGNVLSLQQGLGAIDFDDCGLGFHAYDLVIPLISAEHILAAKRKKETMYESGHRLKDPPTGPGLLI